MRKAKLSRKTKETEIVMELNLDGSGKREISTGIGFFDHMLDLLVVHGGLDITLACKGDLAVDGHHTVEDIGIVLGQLIAKALGDKAGIERYACSYVPMDEVLVRTVIDISGRPLLVYGADISGKTGDFEAELVEEFFRAVVTHSHISCHIDVIRGGNLHHTIEGIFKSFARAVRTAAKVTGKDIPSSKGVL